MHTSQPQHHVRECKVLPTKHNSSVALSGCHFAKPGRLGEITSICGKTNVRQERTAWDMTSILGCARKRRFYAILDTFNVLLACLSNCHDYHPHVSLCFYLPSPSLCLVPPSTHMHTASRHYCASLSDLSDSQNCNATPLTCQSQQSAVIVGETCLEAATVSFSGGK